MENTRALPHKRPIREIALSLIIALAILIASACLGYQVESQPTATAEVAPSRIGAFDIFINNVSMLGLNVLGVLLLGIPNLISGIMNGYTIGGFIAVGQSCFDMGWVTRSLLPHAWLEVPVIILAISFGILPWILIISGLRKTRSERKALFRSLTKYLVITAAICALMLIPAALIESYISMMI